MIRMDYQSFDDYWAPIAAGEVAYRPPPRVVTNSSPVSFAQRVCGNNAAYHSELVIAIRKEKSGRASN
jgi:hypothetical protein